MKLLAFASLVAAVLAAALVSGAAAQEPPETRRIAASAHTCVIEDGEVLCWGPNSSGQLGDGTTVTQTKPVQVQGLEEPAVQVAVGDEHSCALLESGLAVCWGQGGSGQLGDGRQKSSLVPVQVLGLEPYVAIESGFQHMCGITRTGGVRCWGSSFFGQLASDKDADQPTPIAVRDSRGRNITGIVDLGLGLMHSCALHEEGHVLCWGNNDVGQAGAEVGGACDPFIADERVCVRSPSRVVDVRGEPLTGVVAIDAGMFHTCALLADGGVRCWGANDIGQLGDGNTTNSFAAREVRGLEGAARAVSAGGVTTCAIVEGRGVACWGSNFSGQLGLRPTFDERPFPEPAFVSGIGSGVRGLATGGTHVCAMDGGVKCWGDNSLGQLGTGAISPAELEPSTVPTGARNLLVYGLLLGIPLSIGTGAVVYAALRRRRGFAPAH